MTANDLPIITDLNIAPNGDGFFDSSSQHTPAPVDGNGVVITRRSDDTAWQMLVADTSPREFWKRTWHSDQSRWRTWKSFGDMHTINQTPAAHSHPSTALGTRRGYSDQPWPVGGIAPPRRLVA